MLLVCVAMLRQWAQYVLTWRQINLFSLAGIGSLLIFYCRLDILPYAHHGEAGPELAHSDPAFPLQYRVTSALVGIIPTVISVVIAAIPILIQRVAKVVAGIARSPAFRPAVPRDDTVS